MKKTIIQYKKPLLAGGLLTLLLLGYFFRDKWMGWFKEDVPEDKVDPTKQTPTTNAAPTDPKDTILKSGSKGPLVKELQVMLNEALKFPLVGMIYLTEDGIFGSNTEARLVHFTKKKSISINQLIVELAKTP